MGFRNTRAARPWLEEAVEVECPCTYMPCSSPIAAAVTAWSCIVPCRCAARAVGRAWQGLPASENLQTQTRTQTQNHFRPTSDRPHPDWAVSDADADAGRARPMEKAARAVSVSCIVHRVL